MGLLASELTLVLLEVAEALQHFDHSAGNHVTRARQTRSQYIEDHQLEAAVSR